MVLFMVLESIKINNKIKQYTIWYNSKQNRQNRQNK